MQKWEYCSLWNHKAQFIHHLTEKGVEISKIDIPKGTSEENVTAMVIAHLGNEGWELVGMGTISQFEHKLYFKRPKA